MFIASPPSAAVSAAAGSRALAAGNLSITWDQSDPNEVTGITWTDSGATDRSNYVASGGISCGDTQEYFGQAYDEDQGQYDDEVISGFAGTWSATSSSVSTSGQQPAGCGTNAVPVDTAYSIDATNSPNQMKVTRTFHFGSSITDGHPIRAYVPRLPAGTFSQVLYPASDHTLATHDLSGPLPEISNWGGSWYADDDPTTGRGLLVVRDPANTLSAGLVTDSDGNSGSNNSGIVIDPAGATWSGDQTETEYLCFYDSTTWPQSAKSALQLPTGCGATAIDYTLSATAGQDIDGQQRALPDAIPMSIRGSGTSLSAVTNCVVHYGAGPSYDHVANVTGCDSTSPKRSVITGLSPATTYHFETDATVDGTHVLSADQTVTTAATPTPVISSVDDVTGTTATVTADPALGSPASSANRSYALEYEKVGAATPTTVTFDPAQPSQLLTGLSPSTNYQVRLVDSLQFQAATPETFTSDWVDFTTGIDYALSATAGKDIDGSQSTLPDTIPMSIRASGASLSAVTSCVVHYGTTTSYDHTANVAGCDSSSPKRSVITGLIPATTYHFETDATVDGTHVLSADQTVTTAATPTPGISSVTTITGTTATVTADPALGSPASSANRSYALEYEKVGAATPTTVTFDPAQPSQMLTGLSPSTNYQVSTTHCQRPQARTSTGASPPCRTPSRCRSAPAAHLCPRSRAA
jgi:hypothetical protein